MCSIITHLIKELLTTIKIKRRICFTHTSRAAVEHLNFRAGSTFSVPVCPVSPGHLVNKAGNKTSRCNKVDAARH